MEVDNGRELLIRRLTLLECERLQGFPEKWESQEALDSHISETLVRKER